MALSRLQYHSSTTRVRFWLLTIFGAIALINGIALLAVGVTYGEYYDTTSFYAGGASALIFGIAFLIIATIVYRRPFSNQQAQLSYEHSTASIPTHIRSQPVSTIGGTSRNIPATPYAKGSAIPTVRVPPKGGDSHQMYQVQNPNQHTAAVASWQSEVNHNVEQEQYLSSTRFCTYCGHQMAGQYCGNCGKPRSNATQ